MLALGKAVKERRLRLKDAFYDYDRLRCGYCTSNQFCRVLATVNLDKQIPGSALEELIHQFTEPVVRGQAAAARFCYADFLSTLEQTERDIASLRPEETVKATAAYYGAGSPLSDSDAPIVEKAMQDFALHMKNTGLDPRSAFKDFDKNNSGKISNLLFARSFPFRGTDQRIVKLIATQFAALPNDANSVSYIAWARDLHARAQALLQGGVTANATGGSGGVKLPAIQSPVKKHVEDDATSPQQTMTLLAHQLAVTRTRVDDAFHEHDRARTGLITPAAFQATIGSLRLSRMAITLEALASLTKYYTLPGSHSSLEPCVAYPKFIADVNALVDAEQDAKAPGDGLSSPRSGVFPVLSLEDKRRLDAVLAGVRLSLQTRCASLKPTFKDFDRASKGMYTTGTCTRTRFERALAVNGLRLRVDEVELVCKAFRVGPDAGIESSIAYPAFCAAVESPIPAPPAPRTASSGGNLTSTKEAARSSEPASAADAIRSIAVQVQRRGVRVQEFFKDFDPLRLGRIPADKFLSGLGIAGVSDGLDASALQELAAHYRLDIQESSPRGQSPRHPALTSARVFEVNYLQFLHDVETTQRSPASHTGLTGEGYFSPEAILSRSGATFSIIIDRLQQWVRNRGALLPPFFRDYDKHHSGHVTQHQFQQLLKRHGVPLSAEEADVVTAAFADPALPTHVAYRHFIALVDPTENLLTLKQAQADKAKLPLSSSAQGAILSSASKAKSETNVQALVTRIATAAQRGARPKEFFRDADPLRKQLCHRAKFSSAVGALGVYLTEAEEQLLTSHYASPMVADHVEYPRLIADVEALCDQQASLTERGATDPPVASLTLSASASSAPLFAAKCAALRSDAFLSKLLSRVQSQTTSRRLSLRTVLQDYDHLRKGRVTESQFFSALSTLSIKFSPAETKSLLAVLSCGANEVAYAAFCMALEE